MNLDRKKLIGIGIVLLLVITIIWFANRTPKDSCDYHEGLEVADQYMEPYLNTETDVDWYPNYYKCHPVQKGDIVVYTIGTSAEKYFRQAVAVGDDLIALFGDQNSRGWNLTVNGSMIMNNESPYFFGIYKVNPVINLYMKNAPRKLMADEVILLSTRPPGFNDSGLFGIFTTRSGIKGKIVLPSNKQKEWETQFESLYSEEAGKDALKNPLLLPEKQLTKQKAIPSHKPVAPIAKKPSTRKPQKSR